MLAARPREARAAAMAGAAAALVPDADAFIQNTDDPLLYLEFHRHFSHALVFVPAGALIAAALLWPWLRRSLPFVRLYVFCLLGIALAALLDACTSYGTHLLWPFSETRIAWNLISVFDPLFTVLVAIPVAFAVRSQQPRIARWSLLLAAAYLSVGAIQHQRALSLAERYAAERALEAERILVKPTFGNLALWRGIVQTREYIHVAGIRPAIFGGQRVYAGERADRFDADDYAALPQDSRLRRDLDRFAFFADHLLSRSTADPQLIGDARYAMRPDSLVPIWSVRFDVDDPGRRVELVTDREMSRQDRARFLEMLMGRE
jgi:inner membrane protein